METRVNEEQSTDTTLVHKHEQETIKVKYKSKGREMQTQDNTPMCYRRENRRTWRKTSPPPSKLGYMNSKRPSKPNLMYLSPPNFYSNKASRNRVLSNFSDSAMHPIAFAKSHWLLLANPQSFPSSKTLSTLWKNVSYVWVQISSQGMTMGERKRRG